jgi:hypothetical protein
VREPEHEVVTQRGRLGAGGHRERAAPLPEAERRIRAREAHVIHAARFRDLAMHCVRVARKGLGEGPSSAHEPAPCWILPEHLTDVRGISQEKRRAVGDQLTLHVS